MTKDRKLGSALVPNLTVFVSSFCIMVVELVAGRIVSRFVGQSLYTWTSVIGVVLAGITVGNHIGGRLADRFPPRRTLASLFLLAAAACLLVPGANLVAGRSLLLLERTWPVRILGHVLFTFLAPAALLGMISPVVAKMALDAGASTGRTIGNVYAWGAAGSIVGTFVTGFYLIAAFGTFPIIVMMAGVLAAMGVCYGWRSRKTWAVSLLVLVILWGAVGQGSAALLLGRATKFRAPPEPGFVTYYDTESQYSRVTVKAARSAPDHRVMILDTLWHSKMNVKNPLDLLAQYTWMQRCVLDVCSGTNTAVSALVIGGGGYVMPRYLELTRPGSRIHVAEIDPCVTEAAFAACGLPRDTAIRIYNMDARNVVTDLLSGKQAQDGAGSFDVVIGDSINNCAVPYHLTTKEFNDDIRRLLGPDGIYMFHVIDNSRPGRFLATAVRTLRETFGYVAALAMFKDPERVGSHMVLASQKSLPLPDIHALICREYPAYRGRVLSSADLESLPAKPVYVLTDDHAPVENLVADLAAGNSSDLISEYSRRHKRAMRRGMPSKALGYLRRAAAAAPHNASAHYRLALHCLGQKMHKKGMVSIERALNLDPSMLKAHQVRGELLAMTGDAEAAVKDWQLVLDSNPRDVPARNCMAIALRRLGRTNEAVELWQECLAIDEDDATAHYHLGQTYLLLGDTAKAERHIRRCRKSDPSLVTVKKGLFPASGAKDVVEGLLF